MHEQIQHSASSHRDQWLALLDKYGVGRPKSLRVLEFAGGLVQATVGEPPGRIALECAPANVLMFNVSPVQGLQQIREGRFFVSDMLHGEMTLMPRGIPSQWSWNSTCDRLDVIVSPDVFGDGSKLDVVDRYAFRDPEMEVICRRLYQELSRGGVADQLYVESMVMRLAVMLLRRHSTASQASRVLPSGGLTRNQARRVLDYIESNLSCELTLSELAGIAELSLHHFARMFKKTIGVAPYRYVLERRVERAKLMLRSAGASLVDISLSVGFYSQSHFTSTFSRMVGATPTEFQGPSRHRSP
ncbi:MAG TPA: AraC family transcriptional regulator [Acidobacteriaceae bacterium]|jgi:AraC family transcriptional regulator